MEKSYTRLLEEWKANLDLLKFYETLKQQRFAHVLTIQTAFLAIFGLLAKDAIGVFSLVTMRRSHWYRSRRSSSRSTSCVWISAGARSSTPRIRGSC